MESSKKILLGRSLIKESINFWDEDIQTKKSVTQDILQHIALKNVELSSVILKKNSKEIAKIIADYAAKMLMNQLKMFRM